MKNIIIGTAGHVDHGKTALIRALTGTDTDRLKEEKKRGITIELGFAYLTLPGGERAGIIDVPGHEKFVGNMLAGAGGIDLVLLAVAADDGVMPQTREHLGILNLLGAKTGIIVLTKSDLVEPDWAQMISEEITKAVEGSFLSDAPILPVSSHTGKGIEQLRHLIFESIEQASQKNTALPFRIPVDRVFSSDGFGTVITGTLTEGVLRTGDDVMLYPAEISARVRGLQVHANEVNTAYAGQRVAVNLAGISRAELKRGDTLAAPGSIRNSLMADVKLKILADCHREIKNNSRLHFYHGAHETLCKLVLLESDQLMPQDEGYAQLRFAQPVALKKGDRFVVRFYSPVETVGGGIILDPCPPKRRRGSEAAVEAMRVLEHGTVADNILGAIAQDSRRLAPLAEIKKRMEIGSDTFENELSGLVDTGRVFRLGAGNAVDSGRKQSLCISMCEMLLAYHKENPLQAGMRRDELRSRLLPGVKPALCDALLDIYLSEGHIRYIGQCVALYDFEIKYDQRAGKLREEISNSFEKGGFAPPSLEDIYAQHPPKDKKLIDQILRAMLSEGAIISTEPGICFSVSSVEAAKELFKEAARLSGGQVTLAAFRDKTGSSRKYALSLLEFFDRNSLTRKVGDARVAVKI